MSDLEKLEAYIRRLEKQIEDLTRRNALLRLKALPIAEWRKKVEAWDGGCGLPTEPTKGQWLDFLDALEKAK